MLTRLGRQPKAAAISTETCIGNICGEEVTGYDCGQEVSDWLETVLGVPDLKLVRGVGRKSRRKEKSTTLANDSSCLILNEASILNLLAKVQERCEKNNEDSSEFNLYNLTQRFRGNLVVSGIEAFAEENWSRVKLANFDMRVSGPCKRCQMITVEQDSGHVTKEPLRSLAAMKNRNFNFGVHSRPELSKASSVVKVGDEIIQY